MSGARPWDTSTIVAVHVLACPCEYARVYVYSVEARSPHVCVYLYVYVNLCVL